MALRELEREAETYKNLYQSFLQRNQELVQQQSFPITEARVILSAQRPARPTDPRRLRVLAMMLMFGAGLGVCLAALREFRDRGFRTGEQIRAELGLEFLGMLPLLKPSADKEGARQIGAAGDRHRKPGKSRTSNLPPLMRYAVDHPLSAFAETLRAVKIAADLTLPDRATRVIGIASVLPGEGKSTIAMNFASLLSHLGNRTLLIDADLRNPGLTRAVAPRAKEGIVEAVLDGSPSRACWCGTRHVALAVLPAVLRGRVPHTSEFLVSPGMKSVLKQAEQDFAFIVIDLPPLAPVVDVRAIAPQLDAVLLVAEWGVTTRSFIRDML